MGKERTLFLIAIVTMAAPHLGLTNRLEQVVLFASGFLVLVFAYESYLAKKRIKRKSSNDTFAPPMPPLSKKEPAPLDTAGFTFVKKDPRGRLFNHMHPR